MSPSLLLAPPANAGPAEPFAGASRLELPAELLVPGASAVAIATLGLVALLFWARDRSRTDLLLYTFLASGLASYLLLGLGEGSAGAARAAAALGLLLPALAWLLLVRFLDLPLRKGRISLLALPALALPVVVALPAARALSAPAAAAALVLFGGAALLDLVRLRRPDAALLFAATALLLLSALFDVAVANGVLLPGERLPPLLGPAFLLFTALLLVAVADQGRRLLEKATTDALTGLPNRATFLERARRELERAQRNGSSLALAMLDVDHFKRFNDRYGHPAGDRVLKDAGRAVAGAVRGIDLAGRYGGEELVLLLVDVDAEAAVAAVERVRAAIAEVRLPHVPDAVTASAGVALHHGAFERCGVADLIRRADAALYRSKAEGRDRTTLEARGTERPTSPAEVRYR
ncbi:MAG TPA: GGDEF domain-containing protein [Thermoanaerobaculia bacterium]|nr:GGDEF domain-containing protein [Thermoanaerobaculia bacterium]HPA50681.1 GGDEF domain-containing protein [Thermoanaerobaculia bacterium]HQN07159.1 GGDEF domain-containing protein [Thermoanaerobaculia bacterium]HQP85686.1 GGDEF domain-containing protein [Thermoanaerobaculia bacterium]